MLWFINTVTYFLKNGFRLSPEWQEGRNVIPAKAGIQKSYERQASTMSICYSNYEIDYLVAEVFPILEDE